MMLNTTGHQSLQDWLLLLVAANLSGSNVTLQDLASLHGNHFQPSPYYGDQLHAFKVWYSGVHGFLSLTICCFGICANILNVIVLTRKEMISPTNTILTSLAIADMLVMASYLPFTVHTYILQDQPDVERYSYGWALFTLFHADFTVVCHTISIWLTVTLAIWRFLAVSFPAVSKKWCSMERAKLAIVATFVCCPIFCYPLYLTYTIHEEPGPHYKVDFSYIAQPQNGHLLEVNFWLFSVLTKLVPCIVLTGFSLSLIYVLYEANLRRQRLKNITTCERTCDRTTRMLLAVLLLFLVTEFPSGLLALLTAILDEDFHTHVYLNLGEVMDILALVNNAINFILYCTMSRQFRDNFAHLFTPTIISRWMASPREPSTTATTCV